MASSCGPSSLQDMSAMWWCVSRAAGRCELLHGLWTRVVYPSHCHLGLKRRTTEEPQLHQWYNCTTAIPYDVKRWLRCCQWCRQHVEGASSIVMKLLTACQCTEDAHRCFVATFEHRTSQWCAYTSFRTHHSSLFNCHVLLSTMLQGCSFHRQDVHKLWTTIVSLETVRTQLDTIACSWIQPMYI